MECRNGWTDGQTDTWTGTSVLPPSAWGRVAVFGWQMDACPTVLRHGGAAPGAPSVTGLSVPVVGWRSELLVS